jgi:cytochrome c oxidase subunit 4
MSQHILPVRTYLIVFGVLMGLLLLTVVAAYVVPSRLSVPVALTIATIKAVIIMMYFMHLRFSHRLTQIFAGASFLWLGILIALSMADYLSRGWLDIQGK